MKNKLIKFFKENPGINLKAKRIAKKLDIVLEHEYQSLKALLFTLYEEGFLQKDGKYYQLALPDSSNLIKGVLQMTPSGYGFVIPSSKKLNDIFISSRNLGTAFDGDTVQVVLFAKQKKKRNLEGEIVKVMKRKWSEVSGVLHKAGSLFFVRPELSAIDKDIYIAEKFLKGAKPGDKVIVGEIEWTSPELNPQGKIVEGLKNGNSLDAEAKAIAAEFDLSFSFSEAALAEAEKLSLSYDDLNSRIDFRDTVVITIDPDDAKDFDDALSIEELENGNYKIGIHIADVSHYVQKDTPLDQDSQMRGNSTYLVGRVIPMLPEKLSNDICSLVPYQDRLTYSVIVELNSVAEILNYKISKTIINSKRRFTYAEAQQVIETGEGDFAEQVLKLNHFAKILRKKRMENGSINFSTPEVKFILDENGKPIQIVKREMKDSNNLVEEFMLLANQVVATHIGFKKRENEIRPFVYRIHDRPDADKLTEFVRFVKSLGYNISLNQNSPSKSFNELMERVRGHEEETLINELAIRSMAKAAYSPDNIGHYGLGFRYYSHFTSPIRRYADLIVHRLLFHYSGNEKRNLYTPKKLDAISTYISSTEKKSIEAERFSVKQKQVEFLSAHVGEEFPGIISGVTNFGFFVELTDVLAEGLVHIRDLEGDFYLYDEKKYALIGKRRGVTYRLGDKVNVKLVRVDKEKLLVDFLIPE